MNIVKLPVTAFSRKLILSKLGHQEPVKLKAADTLSGVLCCVKPGDSNKVEKTLSLLTDSIEFLLNDQLAKHISAKRLWRVGLHLDSYHRDLLNSYIEGKVEQGVGITKAIFSFCDKYGVELDIDIAFDALYKDYQRYAEEKIEKKPAFFRRKSCNAVLKNGEKTTKRQVFKSIFTDAMLDAIIQNYTDAHTSLFSTNRRQPRKKLQTQLSLYVYRTIGNRTPQYCCQKFQLRTSVIDKVLKKKKWVCDERKLRYAVRSFNIFLKTAPPIVLPPQSE
jgi:hypothetical protein